VEQNPSVDPKVKGHNKHSLQSTVYSQQSTVNSQQSTVNSPQPTVYSLQSTVNSQQSTVYSLQSTANSLQSTRNSQQSTVYSLQSTVYSQQSTVYSPQSTGYTFYSLRSIMIFTVSIFDALVVSIWSNSASKSSNPGELTDYLQSISQSTDVLHIFSIIGSSRDLL